MSKQLCPLCRGRGGYTNFACGPGGSTRTTLRCALCLGARTLDDDIYARYQTGQDYRRLRAEGLSEAAERLGVGVHELAKWECGHGPLWERGWLPADLQQVIGKEAPA